MTADLIAPELKRPVGASRRRERYGPALHRRWSGQAEDLVPYVEEAWGRLERGEALGPALDPYVAHSRELRLRFEWLVAVGRATERGRTMTGWEPPAHRIVPRYLHMICNQVGVPAIHEAYLADVIVRALGDAATTGACAKRPVAGLRPSGVTRRWGSPPRKAAIPDCDEPWRRSWLSGERQ
jgi:hypothetical protein